MVLISGKWYVAPLELNDSVMIPFFILILVVTIIREVRNHKFSWKRIALFFTFLVYLYFLLSITLFPISLFPINSKIFSLGLGKQTLINWDLGALQNYSRLQVIGNILLLVPLSFYVALFKKKYRKFRNNFLLMCLSTLGIEITQLILSFFYLGNRIFDVNDLILNSLGSILGFGLYKLVVFFRKNKN